MDQPTAEEALKKLEILFGEWALEAASPDGESWPGEGRASFEWHESGRTGRSLDDRSARRA